MDVAHGSGHCASWDFEDLGKLGSVKISVCANLNATVAALCDQRRQPSNFELQTDCDQQVSLSQFQQKTWFGLDKMRVLISLGDGFDIDAVAADLLCQRRHIGGGSDHVEFFRLGCNRQKQQAHQDQGDLQSFHSVLL